MLKSSSNLDLAAGLQFMIKDTDFHHYTRKISLTILDKSKFHSYFSSVLFLLLNYYRGEDQGKNPNNCQPFSFKKNT